MFVRQLIGREAGNIIEMPFSAAESCLAMGTVEKVTNDEVEAAGLRAIDPVVIQPEVFPRGYHAEPSTGGGYDLIDAGGVVVSRDILLPNIVAARELAWKLSAPFIVTTEPSELDRLNKADLLKIAEDAQVEIASAAKKADIIAALIAAGITAPPEPAVAGESGSGTGASGEGGDPANSTAGDGNGDVAGEGAQGQDGQSEGSADTNGQAE